MTYNNLNRCNRCKIPNLCYRAVRVGQPLYIAELVADCMPARLLQSADCHCELNHVVRLLLRIDALRAPHLIFGLIDCIGREEIEEQSGVRKTGL